MMTIILAFKAAAMKAPSRRKHGTKKLKTAWILGNGEVPQPWFLQIGLKEVFIFRLHSEFAAFAAETSVARTVLEPTWE